MLKRPSNKPREQIEKLARQAVQITGGPELARAWFKYTCGTCGSREVAPEPNVLPETAVCTTCGATTAILGGGFALEHRKNRFVDWDRPVSTLVIRPPYASDRGDA
jgi:hypothetical protein